MWKCDIIYMRCPGHINTYLRFLYTARSWAHLHFEALWDIGSAKTKTEITITMKYILQACKAAQDE